MPQDSGFEGRDRQRCASGAHVQQDAHDVLVDLGERPRGAGLLVRVRPAPRSAAASRRTCKCACPDSGRKDFMLSFATMTWQAGTE